MRKRNNSPVNIFFLFFIFMVSSSYEFWLDPDRFQYEQGEEITIRFRTGENFDGENWNGSQEIISSLHLYYGGVNDDLSFLVSDSPGDSLSFSMLDAGTVMIAFESIPAFKQTDSSYREVQHRSAKTLLQIGHVKDRTYSMVTGMQTDIIPAENPYILNEDDTLRVKLIFRDSVLMNSMVTIWHKDQQQVKKIQLVTNENGMISFPVKPSGTWMISTLIIESITDDPVIRWQNFRGSLTWGYDRDKSTTE